MSNLVQTAIQKGYTIIPWNLTPTNDQPLPPVATSRGPIVVIVKFTSSDGISFLPLDAQLCNRCELVQVLCLTLCNLMPGMWLCPVETKLDNVGSWLKAFQGDVVNGNLY